MTTNLSLGVSYLGFLNAQLRDLRGFATLANELIQNADDAPGATQIIFDVRDDMLLVENNGVFSDCGDMLQRECPWKLDANINHLCDFHRFRNTASGDKRQQSDTTGAFGIGFVAVYQITDQPELISNARHWIIDPSLSEDNRISEERVTDTAGTQFLLPWAFDANTRIRRELDLEAVAPEALDAFTEELLQALPGTALFLRKLKKILLRRQGVDLLTIVREDEERRRILSIQNHFTGEQTTATWQLFTGDFSEDAERIRKIAPGKIEDKRRTQIEIAVPQLTAGFVGAFHAFLPTQHRTQLPLHINADFYPSSDRKRILFDSDYQGDWNRAAVKAAARALARALPQLRSFLTPHSLWSMFDQLQRLWDERQKNLIKDGLGLFWEVVRTELSTQAYVRTTTKEWCTPTQAVLLQDKDTEAPCIALLQQLNVKVVALELNSYQNLLRTIGVEFLNAVRFSRELRSTGLTGNLSPSKLPAWATDPANWSLVAGEIKVLLQRPGNNAAAFSDCALAKCTDGTYVTPGALRQADIETQHVWGPISRSALFAADDNPPPIANLIAPFGTHDALRVLETTDASKLADLWEHQKADYLALLGWFAERRAEIRGSGDAALRLRQLAVWPAGQQLHPLPKLVMAGGFEDPLQLAEVLDSRAAEACHDLLANELQAASLTIKTYLVSYLPAYFENGQINDGRKYLQLLKLLVDNYGKIKDDPDILTRLADTRLILCEDRHLYRPKQVYLRSSLVGDVLGPSTLYAKEWSEDLLPRTYRDVFIWLGVAEHPRPEDIVAYISKIAAKSPTDDTVAKIQTIFVHIADVWGKGNAGLERSYAELRQLKWLPAEEDRNTWYRPSAIYAVYQNYLFASQAQFLDLPRKAQAAASVFIDFLQINSTPTTRQVVLHLLHESDASEPVNQEVFTYLERHVDEPEIAWLLDKQCILLANNTYVTANMVFWNEHYFGSYRYRLGDDVRSYTKLLKALNVKEAPTAEDAVAVLKEIAQDFGAVHRLLDDETHQVLIYCWQMLTSAMADPSNDEVLKPYFDELSDLPVIPDDRRLLRRPQEVYFADRPRLAEKFGTFLEHEAMARPQDIWRPMEQVGVRSLSQAVRVNLVECDQPEPDTQLQGLLRERRPLILRVLETQKSNGSELAVLNRIQTWRVRSLRISYSLPDFGGRTPTPIEDVTAYCDVAAGILYSVREDDDAPWLAIARELAYTLYPNGEAGQLAPGLRDVLRAETSAHASSELDEMGFAPLQTTEDIGYAAGETVSVGGIVEDEEHLMPDVAGDTTFDDSRPENILRGGDAQQPGVAPSPVEPSDWIEPEAQDGTSQYSGLAVTSGTASTNGAAPTNAGTSSSERTTGTPLVDSLSNSGPSNGTLSDGPAAPGDNKSSLRQRGRLRSYVVNGEHAPADTGQDSQRDEVDRAGVDKVLAYELAAGRHPTEMPHTHPGYDVESCDESGQIVRYIEVKSTLAVWGELGVGMSDTQFKRAQAESDRYWLYVVERAMQDDAQIIPIHDPANQVTQFLFDDGWRSVAEAAVFAGSDSMTLPRSEPDSVVPARRSILDLKHAIVPIAE